MKQPDPLKQILEFRFPAWFAALVVFVAIVGIKLMMWLA